MQEAGDIQLNGKSIRGTNTESWRQNFSFLEQNTILFNRSVKENLTYGSDSINDNLLQQKLKKFDMYAALKDTKLSQNSGARGNKLSGGQRQIITMFRCTLNPRPITVMDEPTASLDEENRVRMYDLIREITGKKDGKPKTTLVISTHDPQLIAMADHVVEV
jgi:ATP-binding cassette subfamily B protein AbcA/BmrA